MSRSVLSLLVLVASQCVAQDVAKVHFVRASGDAMVSVKPDRAEITVGVSTQASTAQAASSQNAADSARVLSAAKRVLGAGGQVKTAGYSLNPQYDYQNGHAPRLNGYQAVNSVIVTVDDLSLLGKVIDAATEVGANNIDGIAFSLRDPSAIRAQALAEAAVRARSNAESIAKALGVQVTGLLEAEPSEIPAVRPLTRAFAAAPMAEKVATPIEAGDLDVHATVSVTLQVQ